MRIVEILLDHLSWEWVLPVFKHLVEAHEDDQELLKQLSDFCLGACIYVTNLSYGQIQGLGLST